MVGVEVFVGVDVAVAVRVTVGVSVSVGASVAVDVTVCVALGRPVAVSTGSGACGEQADSKKIRMMMKPIIRRDIGAVSVHNKRKRGKRQPPAARLSK